MLIYTVSFYAIERKNFMGKKRTYKDILMDELGAAQTRLALARQDYDYADEAYIDIAIKEVSAAELHYRVCLEKFRIGDKEIV